MPKKKSADKRLDQLFKDVTPEESSSKAKRASRSKPVEETEVASPPPAPTRSASAPAPTIPIALFQRAPKTENSISVDFQVSPNNWATLQALDETPNVAWIPDDELLVRQVADQLSLALENARLFQETEARAKEVTVLNEVGQALAATLNLQQIAEVTYEGISRLFDTRNFYIAFYDQPKDEIVFLLNVSESETDRTLGRLPMGVGITSYIIRSRESVLIGEGSEAWAHSHGETTAGEHARSYMGVPLITGDKVVGVIAIQDFETYQKYNEHDLRLITSFASQTAIAVENARLFQEVTDSQETLSGALRIARIGYFEVDVATQTFTITEELFGVLGTSIEQEGRSQYSAREVLKDFIDSADIRLAAKAYEKALKMTRAGDEVASEIRFRSRGEEKTWINAIYKAEMDDEGRLYKLVGSAQDVTERKTNELIQAASTEISDAAFTASSIRELSESIHKAIGALVPAQNFYIALYDPQNDQLSFPYYVNERNQPAPSQKLGRGLAGYVIRTGKALRTTPEIYSELLASGEVTDRETDRTNWLGVPLRSEATTRGVMAIQSYDSETRITPQHQNTLTILAGHASAAIERLLAREALAKSESDLRALFAAMHDVVIVTDRETRYVSIAPTNPSRLFLPAQEMLGKKMTDILPPEAAKPFRAAVLQALESNDMVQIEYQLPVDGQNYWFLASLSRLNENEVFWIARDITDRKNAEEALQRRNQYLAISAEIGRLITSTLDLNQIFTQTVQRVKEGFGLYFVALYSVEETGFKAVLRGATGAAGEQMIASKRTIDINANSVVGLALESGEAQRIAEAADAPLYKSHPLLPDTRSELVIPLRIGSRIIAALDLHSDQPNAFAEEDISTLQLLSDQVAVAIDNARSYELSQQLIKDLREVDKLKSQFLANMSHELRTPLNSIIGFSRVILKGIDGPTTEMQQQDLTAIYNSGQHLLGLINDVLDLARIEAGKMELNFEEVNLADMIQSVLSTAKGLVKEKPIQLVSNIQDGVSTVRGDTMRVRQILINLLSNAAKFTDEGAIKVEAANRKKSDGKIEVLVRVTDTGPGIAPEDQEKLFKAFSQVDGSATRKSGGSGLGLSICANLVQLHGGQIGVTSEPGEGSTFWFTLPPYQQPLDDIPQDRKVILSIDDDLKVVSLYERYLSPQGYYIVSITDAKDAKERIAAIQPYAITLDLMMPNVDGWTLLSQLKSDPATRDIPVIICSILEQADKGFNLGAADYLTKPILEEDLVQAVKRLNKKGTIRNILVIDDSPEDRRLIEKILSADGAYEVETAEDGRQGWDALQTRRPHAVILDLFMPEWDGFTLLEKMREDPELRNLPALVISGADLTPEQSKQIQEFGKRLLLKGSLKEDELLSSIEQALDALG
ncbi:MAG: GAF domain-containing protein [Anaerolineales bacterium]|nr:GAF domain-containing protein [Anaerolineales bacterium]